MYKLCARPLNHAPGGWSAVLDTPAHIYQIQGSALPAAISRTPRWTGVTTRRPGFRGLTTRRAVSGARRSPLPAYGVRFVRMVRRLLLRNRSPTAASDGELRRQK